MSGPAVPSVPSAVSAAPELSQFAALWGRVAASDAGAGLAPLAAPYTVVAVTDQALIMMTPMDVCDPFQQDLPLQRTLLRRHVVAERVAPDDPRFAAGGEVSSLAGTTLKLCQVDGQPAFLAPDSRPAAAQPVGAGDGDVQVYAVDQAFVSCQEVSDAIGRHPQENPFNPPPPIPEPRQ